MRQRKDLSWEWRTPPGFPVQKSVYGRTQAAVLKKRNAFLEEMRAGVDPDAAKTTIAEFLDLWLREAVKGSVWHTTYSQYERIVRLHLKPSIGGVKLSQLSRLRVQRLVNDKSAEGYAPRTVRYIHTTISKAMTQAVDWDLVLKNPAARVKLPRLQRTERKTFTRENVAVFFEAAKEDRFGALYVLAVSAGLRPGELLALKWEDLDLDRRTLTVRRTLSEDDQGRLVFKDETKTSRGRRLELADIAIESLRAHRKEQAEERLRYKSLWKEESLVFPDTLGGPMWRNNLQRRSYKPLLKRAGLPDIRLYDLRHTCATLMFENDASLKLVADMFGHASIKHTADTYTHVAPAIHREAVDRLNDFLASPKTVASPE